MIASRGDAQIALRMPVGMRDWIKAAAKRNGRSMNTEIIMTLERIYAPAATTGEKFGDRAPAVAQNTAALQGGDIINPDV